MELTEDTETSEQFDTPKGAVSNGYYVINVTKSEISSTSAYAAIQSALDEAQENATTDLPYKVFVDPGKYSLTQGLRIYSNTYLCLTGVTLTQNKGSNYNMIKVGDSNEHIQVIITKILPLMAVSGTKMAIAIPPSRSVIHRTLL